MPAEVPSPPPPGTVRVELANAESGMTIAVMSPADFRANFGCRAPDGVTDTWSVTGFDGLRVDIGTGAELRRMLELGDAAECSLSKVAP